MKKIFVLPFDHRAGFAQKMLGFGEILKGEEVEIVKEYKNIIYSAIWKAIDMGIKKENSAVLVDEVFGLDILKDAKEKGLIIMQTVEKSGQDKLDFEYGDDFKSHLLNVMPHYAKVLVRYDVKENNEEQLSKLKTLNDFCIENKIKLLIEPLIKVEGEQKEFDNNIRYKNLIQMMSEMYDKGIEPYVWKIEGLYFQNQYEEVSNFIKSKNIGHETGIIILGRNETKENVLKWINAGKGVDGVVGFAIGRTIFWEPLINYKNKISSKEETVQKIAEEYFSYYKEFENLNTGHNTSIFYKIINWFK